MFAKYIVAILFLSLSHSYLSIKDKKIYDNDSNQYHTHDELIALLDTISNFNTDDNYNKYKKHHNRLKFKKSWYIYLLSIGSVSAGIEGIYHPERFEEGGENYDGPNTSTPGRGNILFGGLVYFGYFEHHKTKRKNFLVNIINTYNNNLIHDGIILEKESFYSNLEKKSFSNIKKIDKNKILFTTQVGISSEKIPYGLATFSIVFNLNKKIDMYGSFNSIIFMSTAGLGFKYYFIDKSKVNKFAPYITTSLYVIAGGDDLQSSIGQNLSIGFSYNSSFNIGFSCFRDFDDPIIFPYINFEF
tara:strand:+ start:185 stop:1087 length:903 start_codon:yes stop_codon:yes gene_type:complete